MEDSRDGEMRWGWEEETWCPLAAHSDQALLPGPCHLSFPSWAGESTGTGIRKFSKAELASVSSGRSFQIAQPSNRCAH